VVAGTVPLREYFEALRAADEKLRAAGERFQAERDRRYAEVRAAEEKALKVKEKADETALGLDREIRAYKDEKANNLRDQITSERGLYVTKDELASAIRELQAMNAGNRNERRLDTAQVLQVLVVVGLAIGLVISYFHK
jgi:hypothetical protein